MAKYLNLHLGVGSPEETAAERGLLKTIVKNSFPYQKRTNT